MVRDFSIKNISYDGEYAEYFWNKSVNPNATLANCMANCTTFVYGACLASGLGAPVSVIRDARNWHNNLSSDWVAIPYDRSSVREGDIIEWSANHVAIAKSRDRLYGSWYTGMNGRAYLDDGSYSPRNFSTLKETCDWMIANYPYRFFHECSVEQECKSVNAQPTWILRKKDTSSGIPEKLDKIIALIEEIKEEI